MSRPPIEAAAYASAAARPKMPLDEYRARREAGERWCSYHQDWHPAAVFLLRLYPGSQFWRIQESCPKGHRAASREAMARRRVRTGTVSIAAAAADAVRATCWTGLGEPRGMDDV